MNYMKSLSLPNTLTFGVEIEFQDVPLSNVADQLDNLIKAHGIDSVYPHTPYSKYTWKVYKDQSVTFDSCDGPIGGEVVSPIMTDSSKCWDDLYKICEMINEQGGAITNLEGAHIHIESQTLKTKEQWLNLIKLWAAYENIIYRFSNGENNQLRRSVSYYAKPKRYEYLTKMKELEDINHDLLKSDVDLVKRARYECFDGLNLIGVIGNRPVDRNTIKIRTPNGTLNPIIWQNNINFFSKLVLYAGSIKFNKEKVKNRLRLYTQNTIMLHQLANNNSPFDVLKDYQKVNIDGAIELADMIFDNSIDKANFLKQYVDLSKEKILIKQKTSL